MRRNTFSQMHKRGNLPWEVIHNYELHFVVGIFSRLHEGSLIGENQAPGEPVNGRDKSHYRVFGSIRN